MTTAAEIRARVARVDVDAALARLAADAAAVEGREIPTPLSVTEDWAAKMIPLLEPYLGPPEAWIATALGAEAGPGAPFVAALALLAEKAVVAAADRWAKEHVAAKAVE